MIEIFQTTDGEAMTRKKRWRVYFLIIVLTVVLCVAAFVFVWSKSGSITLKKTGSILREVNTEWNMYTNYDLGFSMKIPKLNYHLVGDVLDKAISVPVIALEDQSAGAVYITDAWEIDRYGNKTKDTILQDLQKQVPITWKIAIKHVPDAVSLLTFIRGRYHEGCGIQSITPSKIEGVYDLETTHTSPDEDSENYCFINWMTINKYSPKQQKIANWDIGQDVVFSGPDIDAPTYDTQMTDSFRFLDGNE